MEAVAGAAMVEEVADTDKLPLSKVLTAAEAPEGTASSPSNRATANRRADMEPPNRHTDSNRVTASKLPPRPTLQAEGADTDSNNRRATAASRRVDTGNHSPLEDTDNRAVSNLADTNLIKHQACFSDEMNFMKIR